MASINLSPGEVVAVSSLDAEIAILKSALRLCALRFEMIGKLSQDTPTKESCEFGRKYAMNFASEGR